MQSESCQPCSQRRILCDAAKPSCQQCIRARRKCRGRDEGLRIVFYNADIKQRGSVKNAQNRPRKTRFSGGNKLTSCLDSQKFDATQRSRRTPFSNASVQRPLRANRDEDLRPICLFISTFVPDGRHGTMLEFIPQLYQTSSSTSCFKRSLQAVSLLNFMNRYKAYDILQEDVRAAYYSAITSTNSALSDRKWVSQDETLASVWLLSLYELLASGTHTFGERTPWINHVQGTLALLRIRGKSRFMNGIGRQLFTLVYIPIVVMIMMGGQQPPADIAHEYQEILQVDHNCPHGLLEMACYIHEVADWRARMRQACECVSAPYMAIIMPALNELLSQGIKLSKIDSTIAPHSRFDTINDMQYQLTIWTTNLLAIQTLLQAILLCKTIPRDELGQEVESAFAKEIGPELVIADTSRLEQRLNELADKILGCVPFAFGDYASNTQPEKYQEHNSSFHNDASVGAYHMFWPLGALMASPFVTLERKVSARSALKIVGERFCIVQALRYI